eukprot:COSAG01_NODE_15218_length_1360_cov_1.970658_1_plen_45_part_10
MSKCELFDLTSNHGGGGRRCAALPRYVECPATTVAYAIPALGPGA